MQYQFNVIVLTILISLFSSILAHADVRYNPLICEAYLRAIEVQDGGLDWSKASAELHNFKVQVIPVADHATYKELHRIELLHNRSKGNRVRVTKLKGAESVLAYLELTEKLHSDLAVRFNEKRQQLLSKRRGQVALSNLYASAVTFAGLGFAYTGVDHHITAAALAGAALMSAGVLVPGVQLYRAYAMRSFSESRFKERVRSQVLGTAQSTKLLHRRIEMFVSPAELEAMIDGQVHRSSSDLARVIQKQWLPGADDALLRLDRYFYFDPKDHEPVLLVIASI